MMQHNEILWQPRPEDIRHSRLNEFRHWLKYAYNFETEDYESLWKWSTDHPELFWESIVRFFDVKFHSPYTAVISGATMPDTFWFEGATLNYAEHIHKGMSRQTKAITFSNETGEVYDISTEQMWREVQKLQQFFYRRGCNSRRSYSWIFTKYP